MNTDEREIQELRRQGDEITNESLASTRRMKQLATETNETGTATLTTLNDQGEQLNRIERGLGQVDDNVNEAEKNMDKIRLCGCFHFGKTKKTKEHDKKTFGTNYKPTNKTSEEPKKKTKASSSNPNEKITMKRITNDEREDEMEENLNDVSKLLGNLKQQAKEMDSTLTEQNKQLERIDDKIHNNIERVNKANERATKLAA